MSDASFGAGGGGDPIQLTVFLIMGWLILLIVTVNYLNLAVAVFLNKGREIGIRKTIGESQRQVMGSFLYDSILMAMLSLPLILIGLKVAMPLFGLFLGADLEAIALGSPKYLGLILGYLTLVGLLALVFPMLALKSGNANMMIKTLSLIHI